MAAPLTPDERFRRARLAIAEAQRLANQVTASTPGRERAGHLAEPIPDDAEELCVEWLTTLEAVKECHLLSPLDYPLEDDGIPHVRTAQRLRAAASEGRIQAVKKGDRWMYKATSLRHWLHNDRAHTPGHKPAP